MNKIATTLLHEGRAMLPPLIFFFVCFNMLVVTTSLASGEYHFSPAAHIKASLGALIAGKAILIADMLPFVSRYNKHPLILNAAWKALVYFLGAIALRLLEQVLSAATNEYGFAAAVREKEVAFDWAHFWAIQIWLMMLFLIYAGVREIIRAIGRKQAYEIVFSPPRTPTDS